MGSPVLNNSAKPTQKVTAAAIAGAIVVIATWLFDVLFHVSLPIEVGSLLNLIIPVTAAYIKRDKVDNN